MNLSNYCRLCAKENESFSTVVSPNFNGHTEKMINSCCPIEIIAGDNLPTKICQQCYDKLQSSYTFRLQVSKAEKKLNRLLKELTKQSELARLLCADEIKKINEEKKKKEDALNEERKKEEDILNEEREATINEKKKREETWKCYICGLTFSNKLPLRDHLKNIHRKEYYYYNKLELCGTCGKKFETKSLLIHHQEQEHTNQTARCPEPHCNKEFRSARGLGVHHSHAHTEIYVCQICFIRYDVPQKLEKHMLTHSTVTDEQQPFGCRSCSKRFKNHLYCRVHELTHKNINTYYCKKCNICFANYENLTKHTRESHFEESSCWNFGSKTIKKRKILDAEEIEQVYIKPEKSEIEDFEMDIPTFQSFKPVNIESDIVKEEDPLVSTVETEQIYLVKDDNTVLAKRNLEEDPLKLPICRTENINIRKVIIRKINLHPDLPKSN